MLGKRRKRLTTMKRSSNLSWTKFKKKMAILRKNTMRRSFWDKSYRKKSTKTSKLTKRRYSFVSSLNLSSTVYTRCTGTCRPSTTGPSKTSTILRSKAKLIKKRSCARRRSFSSWGRTRLKTRQEYLTKRRGSGLWLLRTSKELSSSMRCRQNF